MAENATILIPDISGFTDFTNATEIDHAAHIITELLELIVESNKTGFTLAEIEGDAVLFYRTGEALSRSALIEQCLLMFTNFHKQLMVIERDTVCQCGACQTASNLTLKIIAHYGQIKEIKVAQFVKATGIDMIVAHRLLKNDIDSDEYILITEPCCDVIGHVTDADEFQWTKSNQVYPAIGPVNYEYATLSEVKSQIPRPPEREPFVYVEPESTVGVMINVPLRQVYQAVIDVDKRKDWMMGVEKVDRDPTSERVGMQHNCTFLGMKLVNTAIFAHYTDDKAVYVEEVQMPDVGITPHSYYVFKAEDPQTTHLGFDVDWQGAPISAEQKEGIMQAVLANLELLKKYLEG